jgi:hypothetical protein
MAKRALMSPHDDDEGFVLARVHPIVDGYVVLFDGQEAGFETEQGKWTMFCPAHGSMGHETSKARATKLLHNPDTWCEACANARYGAVAMKVVTLDNKDKSPDVVEREMRFWAAKSRNSAEKQALFEKMYGVKPDGYWD